MGVGRLGAWAQAGSPCGLALAAVLPEDGALARAGSRPRPGGASPLCRPSLRLLLLQTEGRAGGGGGDSLMKREVGLSLEEMGRAAWPGGEDQSGPGQVGKGAQCALRGGLDPGPAVGF